METTRIYLKALPQLDKLEHELKIILEINVQKTEQIRLNQSSNLSPADPLAIKGQPINIVETSDLTLDRQSVMLKFAI